MYVDCLHLKKVMSWLNTIDVEHVVLEVSNACGEDIEILKLTVIGQPGKETLFEKEGIYLAKEHKYQFEILLEKLYKSLNVILNLKKEKIKISLPLR
ncbi:MAG: hypothetical protein QW579_00890 [Desulfurococcaceae archaeon]